MKKIIALLALGLTLFAAGASGAFARVARLRHLRRLVQPQLLSLGEHHEQDHRAFSSRLCALKSGSAKLNGGAGNVGSPIVLPILICRVEIFFVLLTNGVSSMGKREPAFSQDAEDVNFDGARNMRWRTRPGTAKVHVQNI